MEIKLPRLKIGLKKHDTIVVDQIFRVWLHIAFWISPFGVCKIAELLELKLLELM